MKKGQAILIFLTAAFIFIILGMYIGRSTTVSVFISPSLKAASSERNIVVYNNGKIDINTVTASQLEQLPGIGKIIAQNIVDYREKNGPFVTTDDLLNVEGIGKSRLNDLLEYIYIPG